MKLKGKHIMITSLKKKGKMKLKEGLHIMITGLQNQN